MHDLDWSQLETQEGGFELPGEAAFETAFGELESDPGHELELAAELLEVRSDQELEQFLGKLLSTVVQGAQSIARSPAGQQLGGILKGAVKQALPVVGGALGNVIAPGGQGQMWGSRAGSAAGNLLGLETEGLSQEDREFEVARRLVQFARKAWQNLNAGPQAGPGWAVARAAATEAARQYAPGLVAALTAGSVPGTTASVSPSQQLAGGASVTPIATAMRPSQALASVAATGAAPFGAAGVASAGRWYRQGRRLIVEL
jgi:hypothetical protein